MYVSQDFLQVCNLECARSSRASERLVTSRGRNVHEERRVRDDVTVLVLQRDVAVTYKTKTEIFTRIPIFYSTMWGVYLSRDSGREVQTARV